jgi:RecB family exonuclease
MATVLDVEFLDGRVERVKVLVADRIAVGDRGAGSAEAIQRNPMAYQAQLVYAAMVRSGAAEGSYTEWLATVSDLDYVEASTNPTPTVNGDMP